MGPEGQCLICETTRRWLWRFTFLWLRCRQCDAHYCQPCWTASLDKVYGGFWPFFLHGTRYRRRCQRCGTEIWQRKVAPGLPR